MPHNLTTKPVFPLEKLSYQEIKALTPAAVRKEFGHILSYAREIESVANTNQSDLYFQMQEVIKRRLRHFLRTDFSVLNSAHLLKLCALASKHRPVEPFSFLTSCSMLVDKIEGKLM